jgi:hypothetical protein
MSLVFFRENVLLAINICLHPNENKENKEKRPMARALPLGGSGLTTSFYRMQTDQVPVPFRP